MTIRSFQDNSLISQPIHNDRRVAAASPLRIDDLQRQNLAIAQHAAPIYVWSPQAPNQLHVLAITGTADTNTLAHATHSRHPATTSFLPPHLRLTSTAAGLQEPAGYRTRSRLQALLATRDFQFRHNLTCQRGRCLNRLPCAATLHARRAHDSWRRSMCA
jgi:hypothetical protein